MLSHCDRTNESSKALRKVHVTQCDIGTLAYFDLRTVSVVNNLLGSGVTSLIVNVSGILLRDDRVARAGFCFETFAIEKPDAATI